jgi:cation diffusion facilitator family transporter
MTPESDVVRNPHNHVFLSVRHEHHERRTRLVLAFSLLVMAAEIAVGLASGSTALFVEGVHMATHAGVFLLATVAYALARRHLGDPRFALGTGKFNDLAAFSSALLLGVTGLGIAGEAIGHLIHPVGIDFAQAIPVAALGLLVNVASTLLLGETHEHPHPHGAGEGREPAHEAHAHLHRDHNIAAARAHVFADAAVSLLVLAALALARWSGALWLDPIAGLIGAAVVVSWAVSLIRSAGAALLDMSPGAGEAAAAIRAALEGAGAEVRDLHVWRVGPGHLCAMVSLCADAPRPLPEYRRLLAEIDGLSHLTIEIEVAPMPLSLSPSETARS